MVALRAVPESAWRSCLSGAVRAVCSYCIGVRVGREIKSATPTVLFPRDVLVVHLRSRDTASLFKQSETMADETLEVTKEDAGLLVQLVCAFLHNYTPGPAIRIQDFSPCPHS